MVSLKDGKLQTDLFSKKPDTFNYLHWGSCHPHHTKQSIPYSLAFRLIRICSTEETITSRLKQLTTHLKRRGYPHKKIAAAINRARNTSRPQALQRRQDKDTQAERIPLVHTYNPALPNISSILLKHLPVLHSSDRCRKAILEPPMAAFRRPTNLKDMLVHSLQLHQTLTQVSHRATAVGAKHALTQPKPVPFNHPQTVKHTESTRASPVTLTTSFTSSHAINATNNM